MRRVLATLLVLFIAHGYAQTPDSWRKINGYIYAVAHNPDNSLEILATGEDGIMRKSTDGGTSWVEKRTGTEHAITQLKALSASDFIGLNSFGEVLITNDAGDTWKKQVIKDSLDNPITTFKELVILSETEAILKDQNTSTLATAVYTDDAGSTWEYYTPQPKRLVNVNDTLMGFDHVLVGFQTFMTIVKSVDKGLTYDTVSTFPNGLFGDFHSPVKNVYDYIDFLSTRVYFINHSDRSFYKTVDGGVNFTEIDGYSSSFVYNMNFISEMKGYVGSNQANSYYTTDGGATWEWILQEGSPVLSVRNLSCFDYVDGQWFTTDGYNTFLLDTTTNKAVPQNETLSDFSGATMITSDRVITKGANFFYESENGGMFWHKGNEIKDQFDNKVNFSKYTTKGEDTILIVDNTRIYMSVDGGQSYSLNHTMAAFGPAYITFEQAGPNGFVLVGNGSVGYTVDGGQNWVEHQNLGFSSPVSVDVVSLDAIYLVDFNNRLMFSSDTGRTFSQLTGPPGLSSSSRLRYINNQLGYIYGSSRYIYRTRDGGATWENLKDSIPTTRTYHWDWMATSNASDLYLLEDQGSGSPVQLFYSQDSGSTWHGDNANLSLNNAKYMTFLNDSTGFASGLYAFRNGFEVSPAEEVSLTVVTTSVDDNVAATTLIQAYPNPTQGAIHLNSVEEMIEVVVFDNTGRVVEAIEPLATAYDLNLDKLAPGTYHIKVQTITGLNLVHIVKI